MNTDLICILRRQGWIASYGINEYLLNKWRKHHQTRWISLKTDLVSAKKKEEYFCPYKLRMENFTHSLGHNMQNMNNELWKWNCCQRGYNNPATDPWEQAEINEEHSSQNKERTERSASQISLHGSQMTVFQTEILKISLDNQWGLQRNQAKKSVFLTEVI